MANRRVRTGKMAARTWVLCRSAILTARSFKYSANPIPNARLYKSDVSLDTLYPTSGLDIAKRVEIPRNAEDTFSGYIPMKRIDVFEDAVNPFKVELRFHLDSADWMPKVARDRLKVLCKSSIDKNGRLVVSSDKTRKKLVNVADCTDKLRCMVREACKPPPESIPETRFTRRYKAEREATKRLRIRKADAADMGPL